MSQSFKKLFFCSAIIFVGLIESRETFESEPCTFSVMNIPKKPQAAMPSSFKMEFSLMFFGSLVFCVSNL